jgi:hypothetical protein
MLRKQAYIAGTYTAATTEENLIHIRTAMQAGLRILDELGAFPIVPHCSMNHGTGWEDAMETCERTIKSLSPKHDCIVMLPGWQSGCWPSSWASPS